MSDRHEKAIVFVSIICYAISCVNKQESKKQILRETARYPKIVDSLGLKDLYNQTKWLMYCFQCDNTLKIAKMDILGDSITFEKNGRSIINKTQLKTLVEKVINRRIKR